MRTSLKAVKPKQIVALEGYFAVGVGAALSRKTRNDFAGSCGCLVQALDTDCILEAAEEKARNEEEEEEGQGNEVVVVAVALCIVRAGIGALDKTVEDSLEAAVAAGSEGMSWVVVVVEVVGYCHSDSGEEDTQQEEDSNCRSWREAAAVARTW